MTGIRIEHISRHPHAVPVLARWHHDQWHDLNPAATIERRIQRLRGQTDPDVMPTTFIAVADDVLLGSASLVTQDMDTHPQLSPWLASVFVAPEWRRRGVGRALVNHIAQLARRKGHPRLYLFTPDRADFYSGLGWQPMECTAYRGYDVTIMSLNLQRMEDTTDDK